MAQWSTLMPCNREAAGSMQVMCNNQLLFTKTRLAPDRTIPELELMAKTSGVKLGEFLKRTLKSVTPKIETFYWSDFTALYFLVENH